MYFGYKKYLILAIIGALIIGLSIYFFLNNYFEKISVVVLVNNINKGEIIKEENLTNGYFYKQEIPMGIIKNKSELIGKEIRTDRYRGDFLTAEMLKEKTENILTKNLKDDEAVMTINLSAKECIVPDLQIGKKIMIVSTEKEKDLENIFYKNNNSFVAKENSSTIGVFSIKNYLNNNIFQISENIFLIDGFLYFKNLEIIQIKENEDKEIGILSKNSKPESALFVKCKNLEAPYLAKITATEKYKLLIGPQ